MRPIRRDSYLVAYGDSELSGFPGNTVDGQYSWLSSFMPSVKEQFEPTFQVRPRTRQLWPTWFPSGAAGLCWLDYQAALPGILEPPNEPTHIFWQLGINDAARLGPGPPNDETQAMLDAALAACCNGAQARWPGVQQILIGPWNHGNPLDLQTQQALVIQRMQLAAAALSPVGVFVNWHVDVPMINGVNTVDDIHPNLFGSQQLGDDVMSYMQFDLG